MLVKRLSRVSKRATMENPRQPLTASLIESFLGGRQKTASGLSVGVHEALGYSPVWAAWSMITEDIMRIPWLTYERIVEERPNGQLKESRRQATELPQFHLLNGSIAALNEPGYMTSDEWIQLMVGHALLHKGAYSIIHFDQLGRPNRLEWVHSDRVDVDIRSGFKIFTVDYSSPETPPQERDIVRYQENQVFHINGPQLSEHGGLSLVDYARNTIGRQLATERYADEFYANSAVPQGFVKSPLSMSAPAKRNLVKMLHLAHGAGSRHKFGILDEGMSWEQTGITPEDALMVDALKWGVPEVARFFKIPLHKLADPSRQGWNTTEQENQAYLNSTLGNWISRLEFEANAKLFRQPDVTNRRFFTEFKVSELLKANTKDRAEANRIAVEMGWKTRNEVRTEENLNPIEGLDDLLTPLNMQAGESDQKPTSDDTDQSQQDDDRAKHLAQKLFVRDITRMVNRLGNDAKAAARKPRTFLSTLNEWEDKHFKTIVESLDISRDLLSRYEDCESTHQIARTLIELLRDRMLEASEVQPDELQDSVLRVTNEVQLTSDLIVKEAIGATQDVERFECTAGTTDG